MVTNSNHSSVKMSFVGKNHRKDLVFILFKRIIALTLSLTTLAGAAAYAPDASIFRAEAAKTVSAQTGKEIKKPKISVGKVYSSKVFIKIENISGYSDKAKFQIYCKGKYIKTVNASNAKKCGGVSVFSDGEKYLAPSKNYVFKIRAVSKEGKASHFSSVKVKTDSRSYFKAVSGVKLYSSKKGNVKYSGKKTTLLSYFTGTYTNENGYSVSGKSIKLKREYVRITSGDYKGFYVKISDLKRAVERDMKIDKIIKYAVGMNGGSYVWGGERYRATDCSGLTMLCYRQVGVNLTHSACAQAYSGKANSMNNIKPGDVIICNGYGHAALYIGNGKIIHAMNTYYGIRIQNLNNIYYCGAVNAVRTMI